MKWAKWIISGLGWAFMGPIGGVIGFFVGSAVDAASKSLDGAGIQGNINNTRRGYNTTPNDIRISFLLLTALVMKADGKVMKSELNYVKKFLVQNFGEAQAADLLLVLRDLMKKDYSVYEVCSQIRENTNYVTRMHLFDFLYGLATSDNECTMEEQAVLTKIAQHLRISSYDFKSIHERHSGYTSSGNNYSRGTSYSTRKNPYHILGINDTATDDEVKKAYRRLAMKFHPDKVESLGEEVKKNAEKQFREINEAYEEIKKMRGLA